jgi:hypothetical protein
MDRMQIEFCIDAFVQETGYIPMAAHSVRDAGQLSPTLERFVQKLPATGAWADADQGWFVQGKLSESSAILHLSHRSGGAITRPWLPCRM